MAKTVRDCKLDSRSARQRLESRGKPYYRAIDPGLHLGYRRGEVGGKWLARWYDRDSGYKLETFAKADDHAEADGHGVLNYRQAQVRAQELHAQRLQEAEGVASPTTAGPYTVTDAMTAYLEWLGGKTRSTKGLADAKTRADTLILPALGATPVTAITAGAIRKWMGSLAKAPPRRRTAKGQPQQHHIVDFSDPETVRRRKATANRTLTILKAALNHAFREGAAPSDAQWRRVEPFEAVDAARVRYLDLAEAGRLVRAADTDFRPMITAALLTGCRYGELCRLDVDDFDETAGTLRIRSSKSGKPRHVILTEEGVAFFAGMSAGKNRSAILLPREDGERWGDSHQARRFAKAAAGADLTASASFHALRHTYASLAVMNGLPLIVLAGNLGHADTRMVERFYGHLSDTFRVAAVRASAPRFGLH